MPAWANGAKGMGMFIAILLALAAIIRFSTLTIAAIFIGFFLVIPLGSAIAFDSYRLFISPASSMVVFVSTFALLALVRFRSGEMLERRRDHELTVARDCAMIGLESLAEKRERMLDVLVSYTALLSPLMKRICHCPSIFHGLNQNLRSCNETS